ncbi:10804_t:CDS:2 [Dentiscutata heterogama]|uniref:10804_t:CDS:1 n=1 Tax=Dentiscutata heterogama TaxID=1316150 RepID=A0ACA9LA51_9GLOM|nr:10804_t:CDS:2 [Dentiscutata heterogama]
MIYNNLNYLLLAALLNNDAGVSYVLHTSDEEETVVAAGEILEKHPELLELYECLNYDAALDLLESCQSQHYHPPELHIRRLMNIIVNDQVDDDIASRAYKIFTCKFIENLFTSLTKVDKSDRIMMILDHIVSVIEIDIKVKKEELNSTLLLKLIPKSYGRVRTNIKDLVNALLSPFHEEVSIETARLSQRILKQTMLSSTFKCMLLDLALRNTDFSRIPRQNRTMVTSPLSFVKFVNIYFDSKPYNKNDTISLWRHIFILCSAFQSYVDSKTMRVCHKVFCGLNDEERKLIIDKVINQRVAELKKRIDGEKVDSELKKIQSFFWK